MVFANRKHKGAGAVVVGAHSWIGVRGVAVGGALATLVSIKMLHLTGPLLWAAIACAILSLAVAGLAHKYRHLLVEHAELTIQHEAVRSSVERLLDDMALSLRAPTNEMALTTALLGTRRVELLPLLASSITHDTNNLLSVIRGATDLVAFGLGDDHPAHDDLNAIREATSQLTELNRQLLAWSRSNQAAGEPMCVSEAVQLLKPALQRLVGRKIALTFDVDDIEEQTALSPQDFSQIVIQLVLNAKDATGADGKIRVAVSSGAKDTVLLVVEDNGIGITPTLKDRIFEPFFTTKAEHQHPGLGLSSVKALVERVGGSIKIASSLHESGTHISVYLPKAKDLSMTANDPTRFPQGTAPHLLVLDDEETVRRLLVRLLTRDGYDITEAATLPAALQKASCAKRLDVWVTDANVEGTDATTGVVAMRELHPNIAIVLISGREPDADRMEVLTAQGVRFLAKPFAPAELRAAIDEACQHGSATSAVVALPQDAPHRNVQQAR